MAIIGNSSSQKSKNCQVTIRVQRCPSCGYAMGDMPGSRDAVCTHCGYKDPCCE